MLSQLQIDIIKNRLTQEEIDSLYHGDMNNVIENKNFDLYQDLDKLTDIDKASIIIREAIEQDKLICISADFDCDGLPSLATVRYMLFTLLGAKQENVTVVVGGRRRGRGVNPFVVEKIKSIKNGKNRDVGLLITIDHGTTDQNSYQQLKEFYPNLKIIVTDHHTVESDLYPLSADAFVNVQRQDSSYSKTICGHQTIFLVLLKTYLDKTGIKDLKSIEPALPYIALSTIGDFMSMKSPVNRYLIKYGLEVWNRKEDNKLNYLTSMLDINSDVTPRDISIRIAPLVNAGNRLGYEAYVATVFSSANSDIYMKIIDSLIKINEYRKQLNNAMGKEAIDKLDVNYDDYGLVITIDNPQALVNGIIAGNIASMYSRPTICFNDFGRETLEGSCRSGIDGFNVLSIVRDIQQEYPHLVISANGHSGAFGISIRRDKLDEFRKVFNSYVKRYIGSVDIETTPKEEFTYKIEDLTYNVVKDVVKLAPYGKEFNNPVFLITGLKIVDLTPIKLFYKITFSSLDGEIRISGMNFFNNKSEYNITYNNIRNKLPKDTIVNVKCNLDFSTYRNKTSIFLTIIDIIPV